MNFNNCMTKKILGRIIAILVILAVLAGLLVMTLNSGVQRKTRDQIIAREQNNQGDFVLSSKEKEALTAIDPQCIMVLGCGIQDRETPTLMLSDRLDTAIALYKQGIAPKLLLTGDNGTVAHNEIHVMLKYAKEAGVPEEDIFCDHAGFSTYDSMYRAGTVFQVERMVIVTQSYHMYRSLYIAEKLGITARGVGADQATYGGQTSREIREILARAKDYLKCISKPASTYGGKVIPISGSGVSSHGE